MPPKHRKVKRPNISTPREKRARATDPAIPASVKMARSTMFFGDLLDRPPESNSRLTDRSSLPCGPDERDRVSSLLVEKGIKVKRAETIFSLIRNLCNEEDERPIEADERHVWLGSNRVGIVMSFMDAPTLYVWVDQLLSTSYRNGSMEDVTKSIQHILHNTRALRTLVDAFDVSYSQLASTIAENSFAALVADARTTSLRFFTDRSGHATREFKVGLHP